MSQSPLANLICDFISLIYERSNEMGNPTFLYFKDGDKYDRYSYRFKIKNAKGDYSLEVDASAIDDKYILDSFNKCSTDRFESIQDAIDKIKLIDTEKNKGIGKFKNDIKYVIEGNWVSVTLMACYYYIKNSVIGEVKEKGYTNDAYNIIFIGIQDLKCVFSDLDSIVNENRVGNAEYVNMRLIAKKYFQYLLSHSERPKKTDNVLEYKQYTLQDATKELFISNEGFTEIVDLILYKKNVILQGQPGVGKTFVAERIAYYMMGKKDKSKVETVQFHPAYSYDDFIQGYKPNADGLVKSNGVFFNICEKAKNDKDDNKYFLIIDEINRGNLSKIFGDTMSLIEADKRGGDHSITLTYSEEGEKFFVPDNVYIIGTMNTVDRSIVEFDYALRRRFSFYNIKPNFEDKFKIYLKAKGISVELVNQIAEDIIELNKELRKENQEYLSNILQIGHSYFTPSEYINNEKEWYKNIVKYEIEPLLEIYYKNNESSQVNDKIKKLLRVVVYE